MLAFTIPSLFQIITPERKESSNGGGINQTKKGK
jgi:hypothetical protein